MRKKLILMAVFCLLLTGCGGKGETLPAVSDNGTASSETVERGESSCQAEAPEGEEQEYPMMLMVDGILYTYEKPCEELGRCGMMDGKIETSVEGVPAENRQSNFGEGYSYQYVGDGVDVYFPEEDVWQHFVGTVERVRFRAEIEELRENWFVVRSMEGEWNEGERFMISQDYWEYTEPVEVGMVVEVECSDMVLETDPGQLDVYQVTLRE